MKKYIALILIGGAMLGASAESVSRREAQSIASEFFNEAFGEVMAQPKFVYNGKRLAMDRLFTPFYVFNNNAGGFVIVAADNKAMPILGYSLTDTFNPDAIGQSQRALLSGYAREIEYIRLDDRVPAEAIAAWQNIPSHISQVLKTQASVSDCFYSPKISRDEVLALSESYDAELYSSEIYSPSQWQDAIGEELDVNGSVAIGFLAEKNIPTAVVYGRKGAYFRIDLDGRNNAYYRLYATEFIASPQLAMLGSTREVEIVAEEEMPFSFYDSFIAEQAEEKRVHQRRLDEALSPTEPIIRSIGAGHYDVIFPIDINLAQVYSLSGARVKIFKYPDVPDVHIDISASPAGFYFVLASDRNGHTYGLKLVR